MERDEDRVQELLTPDEVCQVLRISPAKFYRLVTSGRMPAVKIGSTWRVKPNELRHWIDRQSEGNCDKESAQKEHAGPESSGTEGRAT